MSFNVPYPDFANNTQAQAPQVNANFSAIVAYLNATPSFTGYATTVNPALNVNDSVGTSNAAVLQAAINTAVASPGGAIIQLPAGKFKFSGTLSISNVVGGVILQGSSAGTQLIQQQGNIDFFQCQNNGQNNGNGGVRFRDLQLSYAGNPTAGNCINCTNGGSSTSAEFCIITNCPTAFNVGTDGKALQCGLIGCTVVAPKNLNNSTQVIMSAAECFLIQNIIRQTPINNGGPTGCVGVNIQGTPEGYLYGNHISDFTTGIQIQQGNNQIYISHGTIQAYQNSISIAPVASSGIIYGIFLDNVTCLQTMALSGAGSCGIIIDTTGGANTNVQGIFLTNVTCAGFNNAGLYVQNGSQVIVTGGMYASNGQSPTTPAMGAGIVIGGTFLGATSAAAGVRVAGASLRGYFNFVGTTPQPYGLSLNNGCAGSSIQNCDFTFCTQPVFSNSPGGNNYIKECLGYNNLTATVATLANLPASGSFFNAQIVNASAAYFGDYLVSVQGSAINNLYLKALSGMNFGPVQGIAALGPPGNSPIAVKAGTSIALGYASGGVSSFFVFGQ